MWLFAGGKVDRSSVGTGHSGRKRQSHEITKSAKKSNLLRLVSDTAAVRRRIEFSHDDNLPSRRADICQTNEDKSISPVPI
jgi:hypothetical protein